VIYFGMAVKIELIRGETVIKSSEISDERICKFVRKDGLNMSVFGEPIRLRWRPKVTRDVSGGVFVWDKNGNKMNSYSMEGTEIPGGDLGGLALRPGQRVTFESIAEGPVNIGMPHDEKTPFVPLESLGPIEAGVLVRLTGLPLSRRSSKD
jgi:hypothetical protein